MKDSFCGGVSTSVCSFHERSVPVFKRRLTVYVGPMFAGKTEAGQAEARKAMVAERRVIYFRPAVAHRGDEEVVVSHADNVVPGLLPTLITGDEVQKIYDFGREHHVIILDEGQFLPVLAARHLCRLFFEGRVVVYCGLDNDYLGNPFETSQAMMAVPEAEIHRLSAICVQCKNAHATRTLKLVDGRAAPADSPRFETGSTEKYQAVCLDCYLNAYKSATETGSLARRR